MDLLRASLLSFFLFICFSSTGGLARIFDVKDYGAVGDGKADSTWAFNSAWNEACGWEGNPRVVIPEGTFLVRALKLRGPCKSQYMVFQVKGTLVAPIDLTAFSADEWIEFQCIDGLLITGGGRFDGRGASAWPHQCTSSQLKCMHLPISIKFSSVSNAVIRDITSINSKHFHIVVLASNGMLLHNLNITAPADSPNTDGIHIERSTNIRIVDTRIATGDDCISIGPGTANVRISDIVCGPGHGISIGSLGRKRKEGDVSGVSVRNCTLVETKNGVRIKTWQGSPASTMASNFAFEDIVMRNVHNPIIIDQKYCPHHTCNHKYPSRVKINNIKFQNIKGTSASKIAINLVCSEAMPCKNVELNNINLEYISKGGATSFCANAEGSSVGVVLPPSCLGS